MPKSFALRTFDQWIAKSCHRFRYPPRVVCVRKRYFELTFEGVAPELTCLITKSGMAMICIQDRQGEHWDIIWDFDVFPARTASGEYFCSQCKQPTYYPSRTVLWEDHVFERLLRWINGLPPDGWICLWGDPDAGATAAFLETDPSEIEQFEKRFPVVVANRADDVMGLARAT
jgi:hypothetical protein